MTWNIKNIPPQKQNIDTYPLLLKFLAGPNKFNIQNLEALKNANLEIELEGAESPQKYLIYAAIKFYLNHFYPNNQSEKFEELKITGITYDQVMKAPDIRLNTEEPTSAYMFKHPIFNSMLHQNWVCIEDSNTFLLENIDYNKKGFLNLSEKTFLSAVIFVKPQLIDPKKEDYSDISDEVINQATQNILKAPIQDLSLLLFSQKEPITILKEIIHANVENSPCDDAESSQVLGAVDSNIGDN